MKLGEFFISIAVDALQGELTVKDLIGRMGDLEAVTVANIGVFFEFANAINSMVAANIKGVQGLEMLNLQVDMSNEKIQQWIHVAKLTDMPGAVENMTQVLKTATKWVDDFQHKMMPTEKINLLKRMGIDMTQIHSATGFLDRLRSQVQAGVPWMGSTIKKEDVHGMYTLLSQLGTEFADSQKAFTEADKTFNFAIKSTPIISKSDMDDAMALKHQFDLIDDAAERIRIKITKWFDIKALHLLVDAEDFWNNRLKDKTKTTESHEAFGPGSMFDSQMLMKALSLAWSDKKADSFDDFMKNVNPGVQAPESEWQKIHEVTVKVEGTIGPDKPAFLQWFHDEWNKMEKAVQQQLNPQSNNAPG